MTETDNIHLKKKITLKTKTAGQNPEYVDPAPNPPTPGGG